MELGPIKPVYLLQLSSPRQFYCHLSYWRSAKWNLDQSNLHSQKQLSAILTLVLSLHSNEVIVIFFYDQTCTYMMFLVTRRKMYGQVIKLSCFCYIFFVKGS